AGRRGAPGGSVRARRDARTLTRRRPSLSIPETSPAIRPARRAFPEEGAMPDAGPRKLYYKINEVCQLTDTQPYVLRFWQSEFAHLAPTRSRTGQRLY